MVIINLMSKPFKDFGIAIKAFRVAANETVEDVSDALEVETKLIGEIESGGLQPSVDILENLISHFSLRDKEATRLWELAGYQKSFIEEFFVDSNLDGPDESLELPIPRMDGKDILYTDMVHIITNKFGVVINFVQGVNSSGEPKIISKIGMSKEHAKFIADALLKSLERLEKKEK